MKKRNQVICYILVLIMMISGMCFENEKADSSFSFSLEHTNVDILKAAEHTDAPVAYATLKMIGNPNFYLGEANRISMKTAVRMSPVLSLMGNLSNRITANLLTVYAGIYQEVLSNTVIITYIHRQDGKKN